VEYARLFIGPFGLKAPPYGSIYLDNDHTVMGPSTIETIAIYEQEGLARDESFHELPDHIVVELEFLYFLSYRQVEALQKGDPELADTYRHKQKQFINRFSGIWVPLFCDLIKKETDNEFYGALADCVADFTRNTGS
jgi:TorA maturation chaperone TorD